MSLQQAIPGYKPTDWAVLLLKGFGAPVSATNIDTLTRWANAESGGYSPSSSGGKYNPLNVVVQSGDKHTGEGGSQGDIADFGNMADGIAATVRLFTGNKNAAPIVNALRANDQPGAFKAIQQFYGTWGGNISFPGPPADTSTGTPAAGGDTGAPGDGTSSSTDPASTAVDDQCVWKLTMPGPIPNFCLTRSQGRALLGVASMVAGVGLLVVATGIASRRQVAGIVGGAAGIAKAVA